jgi:hypothetical protein
MSNHVETTMSLSQPESTCTPITLSTCQQPVPMHQPCTKQQITCTNNLSKQPVQTTYHNNLSSTNQMHSKINHQVPQHCIHQQVHQPCTKYVPIMHQIHINYDSSRCTNIINYTPHVCANSSTTCLNHVPNMYLNHIPNTYTNITIKIYLTIHHSIHKPNTINHYIKPCATTSLVIQPLSVTYLNQNPSSISSSKSDL